MGLGRGMDHLAALSSIPGIMISYVCDVESQRLAKGAQLVAGKQASPPKSVSDFRRILDVLDSPCHLATMAGLLVGAQRSRRNLVYKDSRRKSLG